MCKKFLVLTKSCRSRTDEPTLVSNTGINAEKQCHLKDDVQIQKATFCFLSIACNRMSQIAIVSQKYITKNQAE